MIYDLYFANLRRSKRRCERRARAAADRARHELENYESDEGNEDDDEVDDAESPDDDDRSQSDDGHDESDQEDLGSDQQDNDENGDAEEENDGSDMDLESDDHASAAVPIELRRRPITPDLDVDDDGILNHVGFSKYRDEIVINQRVDLHSRLPGLSCASRRLLSETWLYTYDPNYKFLIHVNHYNIRPIFERQRIFQLLANTCGIATVKEADTTVVLHTDDAHFNTNDQRENKKSNLRWWLGKYWNDGFPLFDTNLEIMFQQPPSLTGAKLWGHSGLHPVYQKKAEYQKKCFGILKYLRILRDSEPAEWKFLAGNLVDRWMRQRQEGERRYRRHPNRPTSMFKDFGVSKTEADLVTPEDWVDAVLETVIALIHFGARHYQDGWENGVSNIARSVFRQARDAAIRVLGDDFEAFEKRHGEMALP
jgi:hypothetical protein